MLAASQQPPHCAQSNHRSWADFYLDVVATDGNAQMLSRLAVALVFPMFMGAVCVIRSVVLFRRGRKHDKEVRARAQAHKPRPSGPQKRAALGQAQGALQLAVRRAC